MSKSISNPSVAHETLSLSRRLVAWTFMICALWYLGWRATTLNPQAYIFSWVLYGAEVFGFVAALLHLFMTWRLTVRSSPAVPAGMSVDVFIPTINESEAIVRRTLLAARHMDYPHMTWLLDDGNRPEMARLAAELGCRYLARDDNRHAKAGNLNHGLAHSRGEFVVIFDADHAPQRHFLTRTLGYFTDQKVAFVQTPQDFYNLDSYQHRRNKNGRQVWTEQSLFFRVIQRGKDYWNATLFCGSCAVMRRSALEAIGGFATETAAEDLHTSLRLHMQGFRSVYHAESLAFGLAPDSFGAYLGQRVRSGEGGTKVWRTEGIMFNRRLDLAQRLNYLACVMTYFAGWQKAIFYAAPAIILVTGTLPIRTTDENFLLHFLPYFLLTIWVFEEVGRGYSSFLTTEVYNMARFVAYTRATLGWINGARKFRVTPRGLPASMLEQIRIIPQYLVLAINLYAIPIGYLFYQKYDWLPVGGVVASVVWASVNALMAYSLVTFTTRRKLQRSEYRFGLPVPVRIREKERWVYGTVDDISTCGLSLHVRLTDERLPGESLHGQLWLPGYCLPFDAMIKRLITTPAHGCYHTRAYGLEFTWRDQAQRDQLDRFLYGSGLQWGVQELRETRCTPLQWLGGSLSRPWNRTRRAPPCWEAFVYTMPGGGTGDEAIGLIRAGGEKAADPMLLLYHPLKPGALITGRLVTPVVERHLTLKATTVKELDSPLAPVFLIGAAAPEIRHGEVHEGHKVCKLVSAEPREVAGDAAVQTGGKQVVS
jgi:cellulose synthase (UDP-forming)